MPGQQLNRTFILVFCLILLGIAVFLGYHGLRTDTRKPLAYASTVAGLGKEFGEAFGIAFRDGAIYVSDGEKGDIKLIRDGRISVFAAGLDTPSGVAFTKDGHLVVADAGANSVRIIDPKGGIADLPGAGTLRGPVGVAVDDEDRVFVADTYNDRIALIENGQISTFAGGTRGYADGQAEQARFDTPAGLAIWRDKLLVADTGNHRIRVIERDGSVWTLAGSGSDELSNGLLLKSSFVEPTAIAVNAAGEIYVADGNAVRVISGEVIPTLRTLSREGRGYADGRLYRSRFDRPSGLAFASDGSLLIADAENRVVRSLSVDPGNEAAQEQRESMLESPAEFRQLQPARWPYDPPSAKRDIAGTLGELRGDIKPGNTDIHFHNGLDIAGSHGETARFVRTEKVLRTGAADNFGTLRELLRMPTMGYIHIRLGRDADGKLYGDPRFIFDRDGGGKLVDVRVPRGAAFKAGEPVGTLNPMNHVHLIAGRSGAEMNALDALMLPGIADSKAPVIDSVMLTNEAWQPFQTKGPSGRIRVTGRLRVIMQAFDQMDGNAGYRRLGLYKTGYQVLKKDGSPLNDMEWTISFDKLPSAAAVPFVYAEGSHSGATGETIFRFIVTNRVEGREFREGFIDSAEVESGEYTVRACAADYFGNVTCSDTAIEVIK